MSSTYLSLNYHLIFATKGREPCIAPEWRSNLHRYLGGIAHSLNGHAHCIGGTADHVHLLVELRATHSLADFMRDLKRGSSHGFIRIFRSRRSHGRRVMPPSR